MHAHLFTFLFFLPDPCVRACWSLYHVTVGGGTPWDGQWRVTELLMLTVQSVKLVSSTGGSRTEDTHTHTQTDLKKFSFRFSIKFLFCFHKKTIFLSKYQIIIAPNYFLLTLWGEKTNKQTNSRVFTKQEDLSQRNEGHWPNLCSYLYL